MDCILTGQSLPAVNIGFDLPGITNISIDNSDGIRQIMRHLIQFHHAQKIAFIGGIENTTYAIERYQAFLQILKELNIPFDPELYYADNFEQD